MKILVIMGSPRKGNTYRAASRIEAAMQTFGQVRFEYLMLREANLGACTGCFVCFEKGEEFCPIKDRAREIEQMMHDADGVVFASPVYGMNVSGLMKTFIDRFSYIFHRPRFFDKKALLLTTTGALGQKDVLKYLRLVARVWGFEIVDQVGFVTPRDETPEYRRKEYDTQIAAAARRFYDSVSSGNRSSPGFMDLIIFNAQRVSFNELREEAPVDYEYWKNKGWLEKGRKYYVDVPVNPVYHLIGRIAGWFVLRQVRRERLERW
jgi:multimeric flavodoxin WrbA